MSEMFTASRSSLSARASGLCGFGGDHDETGDLRRQNRVALDPFFCLNRGLDAARDDFHADDAERGAQQCNQRHQPCPKGKFGLE